MSNPKAAILQVLPSLVSGGVEKGTLDISKALVKDGFRSIVASAGGPLVVFVTKDGGVHYDLPLSSKNPITMIVNAFRLAQIIRKENVDIVHARSRAPAWSAYFASRLTRRKFITTFHGLYKITGALKKAYNEVMTKGERVIAVSDFIKCHIAEAYQLDKSKIKTIVRGVDLKSFDPRAIKGDRWVALKKRISIPDGKIIITLPGRITQGKGHEVLFRAAALLKNDNLCYLLVGNVNQHPKYYKKLLRLAGELGIKDKIIFAGVIQDMPALYMLSDIVVAPAIRPEAFGRVPVEAQAMKKIVIASNIGGHTETIIDGKSGFLFPSGDHQALADKIREIISFSKKNKVEIGEQGRAHAEKKFSLEMMCKNTLRLYKQLMDQDQV